MQDRSDKVQMKMDLDESYFLGGIEKWRIVLDLPSCEYILLVLMYKNLGHPFAGDEILNNIWKRDYFGSDRVVDDLMRRLRKKMPRLKVDII